MPLNVIGEVLREGKNMNKARPAMPLFEEKSKSLFHCLGRGPAEAPPWAVQSMYHFNVWIQFNFVHVRNRIPEFWHFQMMIISPCCVLFLFFSFFLLYHFNIPNEKCLFFWKVHQLGFCSNIPLWDSGTLKNTEHPHSNWTYISEFFFLPCN